MQKIWKILTVFIVLSLALPGGIFASIQNPQASDPQATVAAMQLVRVVSVQPSQTVVAEGLASYKNSACSLNPSASSNLLQKAESFNLNQPASCFVLAAYRPAALPELTVTFARQTAAVVVSSHNSIAEDPSFQPLPLSKDSALPILVFTALGVILYEKKKAVKSLVFRVFVNLNSRIILNRFMVLRC